MEIDKQKTWGVRSKVWLEFEGKPIMGEGRKEILQAINQFGSILQASRATGISYRRIRGAIREMERIVGSALVRSFRGGEHGGGATLTTEAIELMKCYERVSFGVQKEMDARFEKIFK
jgi:molybdate transport system regulatory protein